MSKTADTGSTVLGKYLMARRLSRNMTLQEMGEQVGKAASTIQSWELGKRMPGLDDLFVLANVLEVDVGELILLAGTPIRELEKRLAEAERRYKQVLREAARRADTGVQRQLTEAGREVSFLRNLVAARKRYQEKPLPLEPVRKIRVPILGTIAAGRPRLAVEDGEEYVEVPQDEDVSYALRVEGDSMVGAGIDPGDIVWIATGLSPEPGDAVAALLNGEEVTVKHFIVEDGRLLLRANNPYRNHPDIPLGPEDRIIGVVEKVIKRPGPPPRKKA